MWDAHGKEYLDFAAGIAVNALGALCWLRGSQPARHSGFQRAVGLRIAASCRSTAAGPASGGQASDCSAGFLRSSPAPSAAESRALLCCNSHECVCALAALQATAIPAGWRL